MPLQQCQREGLSGWKWGKSGKCYTGDNAKARAAKQARAIKASGFAGNQRKRVRSRAGVRQGSRTQIVPSNPLKADPTRSATLRRIFETDLTRRFFALKGKILRLIVDEDAFGLRQARRFVFGQADNSSHTSNTRGTSNGRYLHIVDFDYGSGVITNQRWAALTNPQKVQEFQRWLAMQVQTDIVTTTAETLDQAYWRRYVEEGYRKGAGRAFDDTRKVALSSDAAGVSDFYQGTREEFLRSAFAQPVAIEKVQLLTGRVFTDLKGVTEAMAATMTRTLADGLVQGKNPRAIARDLNKAIDSIGKRRAQIIARTEIIRAHAEGQLDAFENLGVEKVGVMAEWSTAGDDRVCPLCEPLDGTVMKVKEARGILPRHPQCRCAWIPANVGESQKGQQRSKAEVQKSINDSIRAEIPKGQVGKRTLAQQKARTPWGGADKTIAKKRPKGILEPITPKVSPKPKLKVKPRAPGRVQSQLVLEAIGSKPKEFVEILETLGPEFRGKGSTKALSQLLKLIEQGKIVREGGKFRVVGAVKPKLRAVTRKKARPQVKKVGGTKWVNTRANYTGLSSEAKSEFQEITEGAARRFSPKVRERLKSATFRFHETQKSMDDLLLQVWGEKPDSLSPTTGLCVYETSEIHVGTKQWLFKRGGSRAIKEAREGTFVHEAMHAVDFHGTNKGQFSASKLWKAAWKGEGAEGFTSSYAMTSPSEGFAEFGRIMFGSDEVLKKQLIKKNPKSFAFWKMKGLL